jgi:hypothetical protein
MGKCTNLCQPPTSCTSPWLTTGTSSGKSLETCFRCCIVVVFLCAFLLLFLLLLLLRVFFVYSQVKLKPLQIMIGWFIDIILFSLTESCLESGS